MIFVFGVGGIEGGFEGEVFDANLGYVTCRTNGTDVSTGFKSSGEGGIQIDSIERNRFGLDSSELSSYGAESSIPNDVARAGFPAATFAASELGGTEPSDPV